VRALAVIPTYNEAENIEPLVQRILAQGPDVEVVIVDDGSPDRTGEIADRLAADSDRVHVIHRNGPRGRGVAGRDGFLWAVQRGDVDCVIEMDGDLSHDPDYIPQMVEALEHADVVIGSRYIPGGGNVKRKWYRVLTSELAAIYTRLVLGVWGIGDPNSGYRCFRREVLAGIDLETLQSRGPSIVSEVLARCRGYRIREIPIVFVDRVGGRSKLHPGTLLTTLALVALWRWQQLWRRPKKP
jgi:dolichol-phosphate mannosyltransferase